MSFKEQALTLIEQSKANLDNNNPEAALGLLKQALHLCDDSPDLQGTVYLQMGKAYQKLGKQKTALELIRKALDLNKDLSEDVHEWLDSLINKEREFFEKTLAERLNLDMNSKNTDSSNLESKASFNNQKELPKKPGKISAIGGMRLGSGICNVLAGLGFCFFIFPLILVPFGIVEIVSGSNLLRETPVKPSTFKAIPILEIIAIITLAGWISLIVGIISLVFLGDNKVKNYLSSLPE